MDKKETLKEEYFNKIYEAHDDPWDFETSSYEKQKYAATIAAIEGVKYPNALEVGCSIGVLTKLFAAHCKRLLATDVSEKALEKAQERCKNLPHVEFKKLSFPNEIPEEPFDLIVISEVAYYLTVEDWNKAINKLLKITNPKGVILLVHWLPEVHDYPQTGDQVHENFEKRVKDKMKNVLSVREEKYRLDKWQMI